MRTVRGQCPGLGVAGTVVLGVAEFWPVLVHQAECLQALTQAVLGEAAHTGHRVEAHIDQARGSGAIRAVGEPGPAPSDTRPGRVGSAALPGPQDGQWDIPLAGHLTRGGAHGPA